MIDELLKRIEQEKEKFLEDLKEIQSDISLKEIKDKYTSRKKGVLSDLMKRLKEVSSEHKPLAGKSVNDFKKYIENYLSDFKNKAINKETGADYSLPSVEMDKGSVHILTHIREEIESIFQNMGYEVDDGPEVEEQYYNFTALNIPEHHPARDEQDTFFIKDSEDNIMRTQTSPMQIRFMKSNKPPMKVISPGRVFRKDEPDATHTPVFHQLEGLLIAENISFSHLKGTLDKFIRLFFGENIVTRFRPSFFPFTEPSAEVDISCFLCNGNDPQCRVCKGSGWLEILGCGMVHPNVMRNCSIDSDKYSGFAFGMGIERIAMLKYGVPDIRMLYENDLRFLKQFG